MTPRELLVAARARVEDPARWTTGSPARDRRGSVTRSRYPQAVCWCATGAVLSFGAAPYIESYSLWVLDDLAHSLYEMTTESVNDRLGHTAVLDLFDRAIEASLQ